MTELKLNTKRKVNKYMRSIDTSHLWPINNRFNVTNRAIRRLRGGDAAQYAGSIYMDALEREISQIVNTQ